MGLAVLVIALAVGVVTLNNTVSLNSKATVDPAANGGISGGVDGPLKTEREKKEKETGGGNVNTKPTNCSTGVCKCGVAEGCTTEYGFCTIDACYDVLNYNDPNKGNWSAGKILDKAATAKEYGIDPKVFENMTYNEVIAYIENKIVPADTGDNKVYLPTIQKGEGEISNVYLPVIQKYAGVDMNTLNASQLSELLHALSYSVQGTSSPFIGNTGIINPLWVGARVGEFINNSARSFTNFFKLPGN